MFRNLWLDVHMNNTTATAYDDLTVYCNTASYATSEATYRLHRQMREAAYMFMRGQAEAITATTYH